MEKQYVNAAFLIIFLIATVIAIHALYVLLFRPGRRKAAALRLLGSTVGPIALLSKSKSRRGVSFLRETSGFTGADQSVSAWLDDGGAIV